MDAKTDDRPLIRCAVYTRQSVVRPGDDPALASCAVQRTLCTQFIRSMAWRGWYPIGERFDDEGFSGASVERPALERLVARIQDGDIQRVIVYRLDRLSRRLTDWALLLRLFERLNVGLTVVHGAIDAEAGSLARLQLNLLATFAELERDMIGERLADARAARRARGERAAGRVPLGYAADARTKQLVIVESEAATVRWFFTEAANGCSTTDLVKNANALRLAAKSGKRGEWSTRAVLRLLRNPVYAGRRPDGAAAVHTALVPNELFERVQATIAARRTRTPAKRTKASERDDPFLLRGLLVCERCGKTMTTSMSTSLTRATATKAPRYYRCCTADCDGGQVAAARVEAMALEALRRPQWNWTSVKKDQLRQLASTWDVLWPANRRRALAEVFEAMTWRARTRRLLVKLRAEMPQGEKQTAS
ncbi:recombinase family protein [Archangium violaceum]|uniref:recombinase family protein n=1 Tax=Archangium violaceum TaxID=83451 RepID=UPI00193C036F|nr:recombinase family protein [Archangium violaceum]QRK08585.1 recombinase family protein [Archangium violaceum]